ncbi:hypothetical protein L1987_81674 [Smallanthus sonchifolius]|uniref:Uncharacterized protein n=1 Tax=Smallanthus sonchifolius TaxID=185202 RepID=A0ACB8YSP7_9ASTR|nr:hypothetical protein L1987_81674 [Smallanthus sonchifolius]
MMGVLNFYEASYHSFEDESILDDARDFTTKYLKENQDEIDKGMSSLLSHALEVECGKVAHIEVLKHTSRWRRNTSWDKKLTFDRDRLVENFLWTVGYGYLPRFSLGRRNLTKVNAMITMIDDVNVVYGLKTQQPLYSSQSTSKGSATVKAVTTAEPIVRRSANYTPSLWSFDEIQSLSSEYTGEDYKARATTLKAAVKKMIRNVESPMISTLELVDDLQRLGISYHFEDEIRNLVEVVYNNYYKNRDKWNRMDLNLKALGFRLLRQHGYQVPQEIFHNFKDTTQNLKPHSLKDMMGMLNLYEASYHSIEDESILDDARDFTTKYLKDNQDKMVYEKRSDMNPTLLEFAKLDFNMVQAVHIEDFKHVSSLVSSFLWAIGLGYQPHYSLGRDSLAKAVAMITSTDDIYDENGTLDELEKFTDIVDRWDINAIEELPDYMKICFLGFYNTINEISYNTFTNTGILILPYLKKAWTDLFKAYLVEARWNYSGYTPTLKEYLDNAYVSVSGPVVLMHAKFSTSVGATQEILQHMEELENIDHYSSLILRLSNDLATSTDEMARGYIQQSVQCHMHESGATEEEARGYIKEMIRDAWKKLNKERALTVRIF